ncbi:MAG: sigma-70 family RNA polymerase sigma factor [Verrucomicrobia bacterium]|nr:sigma-70 family RNA polymerase sigma factor [Verrucomicrobiota bacterium]
MLVSDPRVRASLRGIARSIVCNASDHDDLLQEMLIHLWQTEQACPGQTESWYMQSCKYHGLDYAKRGRSVDSKRRSDCLLLSLNADPDDDRPSLEPPDERDFREELFVGDVLSTLRGRLTRTQRVVLDAFAQGESVSEVSQALGCSHQYVSKQRKKIANELASVLA